MTVSDGVSVRRPNVGGEAEPARPPSKSATDYWVFRVNEFPALSIFGSSRSTSFNTSNTAQSLL